MLSFAAWLDLCSSRYAPMLESTVCQLKADGEQHQGDMPDNAAACCIPTSGEPFHQGGGQGGLH